MTYSWSDWNGDWDHENMSPYVHWRKDRGDFQKYQKQDVEYLVDPDRNLELHNQSLDVVAKSFRQILEGFSDTLTSQPDWSGAILPRGAQERFRQDYGQVIDAGLLLPPRIRQAEFDESRWALTGLNGLPDPPPQGSVITGVIDTGIALGHRRFQHNDGKTRILAAWQQNAPAPRNQRHLPFGREFFASEIDALLDRHWPTRPTGAFDEDSFNQDTGVLDMHELDGHRDVAMRAAHGTHVLDLAAGTNPTETDAALLEKMPIIAINLPSQNVLGLSGALLEFFIILGASRIVNLTDTLWFKALRKGSVPEFMDGKRGYRIVINISFGKSAGSPDGDAAFHQYIENLNLEREMRGFHPVEFIMPAGNDNLKRGNAIALAVEQIPVEIPWRILPEDQTSNYLEVYSYPIVPESGVSPASRFEIGIAPPGQPELPLTPCRNGAMIELGTGVARVYCQEKQRDDGTVRVQLLICTAPTYPLSMNQTAAPAGVWKISVRDRTKGSQPVLFGVQTDQSARPNSKTGLRSYLDDKNYNRFDRTGRQADTFSFQPGELCVDQDTHSIVKRHGCMNALSGFSGIAVVAGYRLSDARPASYSGTGLGRRLAHNAKGAPTMAMASDDSYAHPGQLAAGSRDGSAVPMSGTSAATALATRHVVWSYLNSRSSATRSPRAILYNDARATDPARAGSVKEVDIEKTGGGRLLPPVSRMSQSLRRTFTTRW